MKRREIRKVISDVGAMTESVEGTMTLMSRKTGESVEVAMPSTLAIVRGVLAWFDGLLDCGGKPEASAREQLQILLTCVGTSIARDLSDDEAE